MGFNIQCNNKGCHKYQEPLLDIKNDVVLCSECNKPIDNVTVFAKTKMKDLGQIYRGAATKQQAFAVQCKNCNKQATPKVEKGKNLVCPHCGVQHDLSGPFKQTLLTFLNIKDSTGN